MDPVDVDWLITQVWPGGETFDGYVPRVGEHVLCIRVSDDETLCGTVDDNRCGLFLTCCDGRKQVLTAARWYCRPTAHCAGTGPV